MSKVNSLLAKRLEKKGNNSKMAALAEDSAKGNLTSFSGLFHVTELSLQEREGLEELLCRYATGEEDLETDLQDLASITSEVKAITNQAALLHGERIKRAQRILTRYRDGAFTAWLMNTYGNRQTPYNFLQYFEFYQQIPRPLHTQLEKMPRQAIYTLASRSGSLEKKQEFVESYAGETKDQLILRIRESFPLPEDDKRSQNSGESLLNQLTKLQSLLSRYRMRLTTRQKKAAKLILQEMMEMMEGR